MSGKLLRLNEVRALVPLSKSMIYLLIQRGAFPAPVKLTGARSVAWRSDRALDKEGNTIDFYLSPTRNAKAAKCLLGKALNGLKDGEKPEFIHTDKAPAYGIAISELKTEGKCPQNTVHRQVKYLNHVIEADLGKLKQRIRPVRGFKTLKTAGSVALTPKRVSGIPDVLLQSGSPPQLIVAQKVNATEPRNASLKSSWRNSLCS